MDLPFFVEFAKFVVGHFVLVNWGVRFGCNINIFSNLFGRYLFPALQGAAPSAYL